MKLALFLFLILAFEGTKAQIQRPRPSHCRCRQSINPVCAESGKTYLNKCEAECDDAEVQCHGKCPCPTNEQLQVEEEEEQDVCQCCDDTGIAPRFCHNIRVDCRQCKLPVDEFDSCDCCKNGPLPAKCASALVNCNRCPAVSQI